MCTALAVFLLSVAPSASALCAEDRQWTVDNDGIVDVGTGEHGTAAYVCVNDGCTGMYVGSDCDRSILPP